MRYSHRLMLCCLVCAAMISQKLPAQTADANAKPDDKVAKEKAQAEPRCSR